LGEAGWAAAGQELDRSVTELAELTLGGQTALYGGGTFRFGGGSRLNGLFRWDGRAYQPRFAAGACGQ